MTLSNRLAKSKLTSDGVRVLKVLQNEYGMEKEAALRLMANAGPLFAPHATSFTKSDPQVESDNVRLKRKLATLEAKYNMLLGSMG